MNRRFLHKITDTFSDLFSFQGQLVPQADAEKAIREGVSFRGTSLLVLVFAIFIASLGLNTNSTAVIIGAMLISPLMGPIIGVGLGVGIHDYPLIKRCLRNLLVAAVFSVVTATLYFLISPVNEQHSELLARTSPTIYDVLIGFFGGAAGIIALGSNNKGNVIPGVAIATALMPPLCTAGYGLATWQPEYFLGASYLFVINSIYIAFATFLGVKIMKFKGAADGVNERSRRVRRIVYFVAVLTMLPSIYLTYRMIQSNKYTMHADQFIREECDFPDTQVLSRQIGTEDGHHTLTLTLIGRPLPADSLHLALTERLKYYGLEGTVLKIYQGGEAESQQDRNADVYTLAQATIQRQRFEIDSLSRELGRENQLAVLTGEIAPEIRVLFPQIRSLALVPVAMEEMSDTADVYQGTVAIVSLSAHLSPEARTSMAHWLEARLNTPTVRIVEY